MALRADELLGNIAPYLNIFTGYLYLIGEILGVLIGIAYIISLFMYNVKIEIYEYTKGQRAVIRQVRAREVYDKKSNTVILKIFDLTIVRGKTINIPESDCIFNYKSYLYKKMYKFVLKDGIYYPVQNYIIGSIMQVRQEDGSLIGITSGIEISRDFDAEESILNGLERKATMYRNKKPVELVAMYGLMIICILSATVIIVYSLKRVGDLFETLQQLKEPIKAAVQSGISQKLGPG